MDLSVITVTWNSKKLIGEQVKSVMMGCRQTSCEQIIIDNDSTDGTVAYIQKTFPHVKMLPSHKNLGFGAANNRGLKLAHGDFYLFLNPDMRVDPGSIDIIIDWMKEHKDVGIAAPKLVDEGGNLNEEALPRRFPKVWEQVALTIKLHHFLPSILDKYLMKGFDAEKQQDVDSVRGSFMVMRKELVQKLGWAFDPRYFIWYEDVDICREAKKHGYRVVHTPVISAVDYIGQSFKQRTSLWKQKNFTKSMLTYFQKWEPMHKWIWIALARPVGIGMVKVRNIFSKK